MSLTPAHIATVSKRRRRRKGITFLSPINGGYAVNATDKALIAVRSIWHIAGCQQLLKEGA